MSSPFFTSLVNAGIKIGDATTLEAAYQNEPEFLEGLEQIAMLLQFKQQPTGTAPAGEPWKNIYSEMSINLQAGQDHDQAWATAISKYDVPMQFSLTAVLQVNMQQLLDQETLKNKKRIKTKQYLREFKQLGYKFYMNICDDSLEYENGKGVRERLTDPVASLIYRRMADSGISGYEDIMHCMNIAAYTNRYHPIQDYLSRLTYDGGSYIQDFANYIQDERGVFHMFVRKWLIGAVAKAFTGGQNPMLVLDGPQNIGKSWIVKFLSRPLPEYFVEASINAEEKDDQIKLMNKWIWEVKELGSTMRKSDLEALKGFLTAEEVTVRKPYGHFDIRKPALASFVGTVNNAGGILSDPTGSRRFHIVKLIKIDWSYTKLDMNKIWAEAVAAYLTGEQWTLSDDERKLRDEINESYQVDDPVEGLLLKYFIVDPKQVQWWIPSSDILKILEDPYQGALKGTSRSNAMQLGQLMTKLGCERCKRRNTLGQLVNGYAGIKIYP